VVVHPPAPDVDGLRRSVDVEPPEAEAALGVLERRQAPRRPRVEVRAEHLVDDRLRDVRDGLAHLVQELVRTVEVRLLGGDVRMCHV
jgi:hypothetical protein